MSKRKQNSDMDVDKDSSDEETPTLVDVDFDFFNPNPKIDYHAVNRLLIQLFGPDAESLQTGVLAELLLEKAEKSGVGSTIKTDGEEGDPYAFLTVLSLDVHRVSCYLWPVYFARSSIDATQENSAIKLLIDYVLSKTSSDTAFHGAISSLLAPKTQLQSQPQAHVGLVICERLINMPVQVIPPMYRMLVEEMEEAVEDGDPYTFTHYLFLSRVYRLTPEEEETMAAAQRNSKRYKSGGGSQLGRSKDGVYGFHEEDEEIIKHATHTLTYSYTNAPPRDKESVGLDIAGRVMLVPADRFEGLVRTMGDMFAVPGSGSMS
ncbi:p21-C-terminal region-binding protein-domain-containing protein [Phlebopus sp. FC_14]|nr:p21-C-terminal region-binding protein-domain-containing protein [Phlebopus sp. FC_14]